MNLKQEIDNRKLLVKLYMIYVSYFYAMRCLYSSSNEENKSSAYALSLSLGIINIFVLILFLDFIFDNSILLKRWLENQKTPLVGIGMMIGAISFLLVNVLLRIFNFISSLTKRSIHRTIIGKKQQLQLFGIWYIVLSISSILSLLVILITWGCFELQNSLSFLLSKIYYPA